eukprot:2751686-Pleurochrysis_carterae.AAC.2
MGQRQLLLEAFNQSSLGTRAIHDSAVNNSDDCPCTAIKPSNEAKGPKKNCTRDRAATCKHELEALCVRADTEVLQRNAHSLHRWVVHQVKRVLRAGARVNPWRAEFIK